MNVLRGRGGFTLIEVMIALTVLASISLAIYLSVAQTQSSKEQTESRDDINHAVHLALGRITEELNTAFLVQSKDLLGEMAEGKIVFEGTEDRVSFVSFANTRYAADARESDVAWISYYTVPMPEESEKKMLMRRTSTQLDDKLASGGRAYPLIEQIEGIRFEYLDSVSGEYKKNWNSASLEFSGRLPLAVKISLSLILPEEEEAKTFTSTAMLALGEKPIDF